jgi:hypothetical protein
VTDARLRDLWRRGRSGDGEARAQHLRERLRAGELATTRLEVAARLGDPAARLALEAPPDPGPDPIASLETLSDEVARRVAVVCARAVAGKAVAGFGKGVAPTEALAALEATVARPDDPSLPARALVCADALVEGVWALAADPAPGGSDEGLGALRALAWAVRAAGPAAPAHAASALREALDVARAADDAGVGEGDAEATLRDAVLDALLAP